MGEGSQDDAREALGHAAGGYASYPAYRRQFDGMGLGDVGSIVDGTCLQGDEDLARRRLATYVDAGCELPVVYPVPYGPHAARSVTKTLQALGPAV